MHSLFPDTTCLFSTNREGEEVGHEKRVTTEKIQEKHGLIRKTCLTAKDEL